MNALIIGGTGLISQGIVKHLLPRGDIITVFNRARRQTPLPADIQHLVGDRNDPQQLAKAAAGGFDVVIDMVCFDPKQAEQAVTLFSNKTQHFIFCSTVCTYGTKIPPNVFINESFPQQPTSNYGQNKLACEKIFLEAHETKKFQTTIIRPSHTYGPGNPLIDNLEPDPVAWDRIQNNQPILCAADGLGLWVSTHRDDVGKAFAHAALNPKTFGQSYNATQPNHFTWRDYYRTVAAILGQPAKLLFMPANWITQHDPARFNLLKEITAFHGPYDSTKAQHDIPEFRCDIDFATGAKETLEDAKRRNALKPAKTDALYQQMVDEALATAIHPIDV